MSFNIELEGGSSVRLPTAGKYCDRDIVVTATGSGGGYDEGYTDGQQAEYDRFWDVVLSGGERTNLASAFAYTKHTKETFKPPYDLRPVGDTDYMFYNIWVATEDEQIDMSELEEELGIVFDFSQCTRMRNVFYTNLFKSIGTVDVRNATEASALQYCFYAYGHANAGEPRLQRIDKIISSENTEWTSNSFGRVDGLTWVRFEGVIAKSTSLQWSGKLDKASIESFISVLSTTTTGVSVTLSKVAVDNAFETSAGAGDGSTSTEWTTLANTRSNWTINLV